GCARARCHERARCRERGLTPARRHTRPLRAPGGIATMNSPDDNTPDNDGAHGPERDRSEDELVRDLESRAGAPPAESSVRAALDRRIERRATRKRTTSLIAVTAAVVLIAGGAM